MVVLSVQRYAVFFFGMDVVVEKPNDGKDSAERAISVNNSSVEVAVENTLKVGQELDREKEEI